MKTILPSEVMTKITFKWVLQWTQTKLCICIICLLSGVGLQAQSLTFTSSGTFNVPAGVTSVQAEVWGGGGAGGGTESIGVSGTHIAGGGGGGGYTKATDVAVPSGGTVTVSVGGGGSGVFHADGGSGGNSSFGSIVAYGGGGGKLNGNGGAGGTGTFSGGSGSYSCCSTSGGGGGGAGNAAAGGDGNIPTAGAGGVNLGGAGGAGRSSNGDGNGASGLSGGGAGSRSSGFFGTFYAGGSGYQGQVIVTYTCPSYELTSTTAATTVCGTSAATVTIYSATMSTGNYQLTYSVSGATTVTNQTVTVAFTQGSPGSGIFSTSILALGANTITISSISSAGCSTTQSVNNSVAITVIPASTAVAGPTFAICETTPSVNITSGASATNYTSVLWTTSGSGTFTNVNSLTLATYAPSAADIAAGNVMLSLTTTGAAACSTVSSGKLLVFTRTPVATAGGSQTICPNQSATVTGASSANGTISWTENGAGSITAGATTLTPVYTAAAADAGQVVTLTMQVSNAECTAAMATYTINVSTFPTAFAGPLIKMCANSGTTNITAGATASNNTSILWTSNGTGTISNPTSLTAAAYTPGPGESGAVIVTLTALGNGSCVAAAATKTLSIAAVPITAGNVTIFQNGTGNLTASTCPSPSYPTDVKFPTAATNSGTAGEYWNNAHLAQVDDNNSATWSISAPNIGNVHTTSRDLYLSNYNFNIPADAIILGISVQIARFQTGATGNAYDYTLHLVKAGTSVGNDKAFPNDAYPTAKTYRNYGSSSDLWGTTWTPAEINSGQFGVALSVYQSAYLYGTSKVSVDAINVTVQYQIPATLRWYTVSSGGTSIGSGSPFNPVGVSGSSLANTNTPGTTTFYAECAAVQECRIPVTFTINPCATATVPYLENFESAITPAMPICTSVQTGPLGNTWFTSNSPGNGFTSKTLQYSYDELSNANTWFYTKGIALTGGVQYSISYRYGNSGSFYSPESFDVAMGTSPDAAAMSVGLAGHNVTASGPLTNLVNFTPASSGTYYFGFHATSPRDRDQLYVDDISVIVSPLPGCPASYQPANATTNVSRDTSLTWAAVQGATTYNVYFGTSPTPPLAITAAASIYTPATLAANTTYYWKVNSVNVYGTTTCAVNSFTTGNLFNYCIPTTTNGCGTGDHITNTNFTTINNNSGACLAASYSNYRNGTAGNVVQAGSYPISVSVNNAGTELAGAWIDWNQNSVFDASEFITLTDSDNVAPWVYTGTVSVPANAVLGSTVLRVRSQYNAAIAANSACATYSYGETEDYTVNVTACTPTIWYADIDNDGFGNPAASLSSCVQPAAYVANNTDCNDNNVAVHQTYPFYADADGDTYGVGNSVSVCAVNAATPPAGYSINNTDCNDNNAAVHQTDPFYADADGDSYGAGSLIAVCAVNAATPPAGYSINNTDCNDNNAAVHQTHPFYADADGDTFGAGSIVNVCAANGTAAPVGYSVNNSDCNDNSATVYQSATLYVDADHDGYASGVTQVVCYGAAIPSGYLASASAITDCNDNNATVFQSVTLYADADQDGYSSNITQVVCSGSAIPSGYLAAASAITDCNDNNATVFQSATLYVDADQDGYASGVTQVVCSGSTLPSGYLTAATVIVDCNDSDNTVYRTATFYVDADNDGYTSGISQQVCYGAAAPSGFVAVLTAIDCNDSIAAIHPGATEIAYNGIDDDCDGLTDEGYPQITTSLLASDCNSTLASIGSLVGITTLAPGNSYTGYRIRATLGNQVQVIERTVPHFTMQEFASYAYATTYTIDIQLQRNGVWLGYYGPTCQVSTPAILADGGAAQVSPSQCGITLPKINTLIATTSLAGVTGYRFKITNLTDPSGPNAVQTLDRSQNWFSLQMLTRYNYGTTYRVEVAVKSGTGAFGGFGSPCEVSSPPAPSLANCAGVVASGTAYIAATSLPGVTQYRFQITRQSDMASATIDRNINFFTFNSVPAAISSPGVLYAVRVAIYTAGTWSPFGDACEITSPGTAARFTHAAPTAASTGFKATAYPNPFASEFAIAVTTSSDANVELKIYDMLGKLIESREVKIADLDLEKIGKRYPSGVYNVIISQDEIVKTLRVIKR